MINTIIMILGVLLTGGFWVCKMGDCNGCNSCRNSYEHDQEQLEETPVETYKKLYNIWNELDELSKETKGKPKEVIDKCKIGLEAVMEEIDLK